MFNKAILFTVAASALATAAPSHAAMQLFAGYTQYRKTTNDTPATPGPRQTPTKSLTWATNTTPPAGTAGTLSTLVGATPATTSNYVNFQFFNNELEGQLILAAWTFNANSTSPATTTVNPAQAGPPPVAAFTTVNQPLTGTFAFRTVNAFTSGPTTWAAGSLLLGGTYTGNMSGNQGSSSGSIRASTLAVPLSVTFASDFLTFLPGSDYDVSVALSSISPTFARIAGTNKVARGFTAASTGSFSSDPAPIVNGIPEPEVWGLLVVGFGLVGVQVRRRSRQSAVAA